MSGLTERGYLRLPGVLVLVLVLLLLLRCAAKGKSRNRQRAGVPRSSRWV